MIPTLKLLPAAEYVGLHPETLRERAKAGIIPGAKPGKRWVFEQEDLDAYLISCHVKPPERPEIPWHERDDYDLHSLVRTSSAPIHGQSGIYFLLRKNVIVYIGQTTRLLGRLSQHLIDGKDFDSYTFFPCEQNQLRELETRMILKFKPKLNGRGIA